MSETSGNEKKLILELEVAVLNYFEISVPDI